MGRLEILDEILDDNVSSKEIFHKTASVRRSKDLARRFEGLTRRFEGLTRRFVGRARRFKFRDRKLIVG